MEPDDGDYDDEPSLKYVRGSMTSRWAAEEAEPSAGTQRARVLEELRKYPHGLTDHQLQELLAMNPSTERPRRIELVEAKLVQGTGTYRPTPSGRRAEVWVAIKRKPVQLQLLFEGGAE